MQKLRLLFSILCLAFISIQPARAQGSFMARYRDGSSAQAATNYNLFDVCLALQLKNKSVWVVGQHSQQDSFYVMSTTTNGSINFIHRFANKASAFNTQGVVSSSGMVFFIFMNDNEDTLTIWKMSPAGTLLLAKSYQAPTTVRFSAMAPTSDAGFMAGGGGCIGFNYFMCVDSNANILWNKNYTPGGTNISPLILKIESIDGSHFRAWGGTTLNNAFSMTNIDKSGPSQITYRLYSGVSGGAMMYTNVSRSALRKDRYFVHLSSYPVQGMSPQAWNQFSMAYSDTLGNLKWMKLFRLPDSTIFYLQNSYSLPTRDGGIMTVSSFGNKNGFNSYKLYNVYIKIDSSGNVVKQVKGGICDTVNEAICAFTPLAGDSSFMIMNRSSSPGALTMGRVSPSLKSICTQSEYQCSVFNNMPVSSEDVLAYGYDHTYVPLIAKVPTMASIQSARQYYCQDTVALAVPVEAGQHRLNIRLYPNPASKSVHVTVPHDAGSLHLVLINTAGQMVTTPAELHEGDNMVDISGLATGLYTYKVWTDDGGLGSGGFAECGDAIINLVFYNSKCHGELVQP